jgi:hypothetical protein
MDHPQSTIVAHHAGAQARGEASIYRGACIDLTFWHGKTGDPTTYAITTRALAIKLLREIAHATIRVFTQDHVPPDWPIGEGLSVRRGFADDAHAGKILGWLYVNDRGQGNDIRLVARGPLEGAMDGETWVFVLWSDGTRSAHPYSELVPAKDLR